MTTKMLKLTAGQKRKLTAYVNAKRQETDAKRALDLLKDDVSLIVQSQGGKTIHDGASIQIIEGVRWAYPTLADAEKRLKLDKQAAQESGFAVATPTLTLRMNDVSEGTEVVP